MPTAQATPQSIGYAPAPGRIRENYGDARLALYAATALLAGWY